MANSTPQSSPAKLSPGTSPGGGRPGTPGGVHVSGAGGANIKVVVRSLAGLRCRPLNARELARVANPLIRMSNGTQTFLDPPETAGNVSATDNGVATSGGRPDSPRTYGVGGSPATKGREREKRAHAFSFDHSYLSIDKTSPDYASQNTLYNDLGIELLDHSFAGYNTCIFAYGQTGSGKSYSMMGYGQDKGIIPLTTEELFRRIEEKKGTEPQIQYRVEVSYMEIYNEKVRDLLNPTNRGPLKVREHPSLGPYVEDLSRLTVDSNADLIHLMEEGNVARTVAATKMNETSSRSHAVFTLILTQTRLDETTNLSGEKMSKISLVDLAGSERANSTGATGARLKEGANINKSLTTLGKVIQALAAQSSDNGTRGRRKKEDFVPFRDSVLTWLLKESLGGNSKTCMIATISPADYEETLSTLRYADQAKRIKTNAVINEDPTAKLIRSLKEELEELRGRAFEKASESEEFTFDQTIPPEKQFVTYRTRAGEIKTVSKLELQENLEASEKLMASLNESWEEKMRKTAEIAVERERTLEELGISVDKTLIGVHAPRRNPHLVNLSEDPLMSECLVYQIPEGRTLVGSADAAKAAIKLSGGRVKAEHCVFTNQGDVTLMSLDADAVTLVNGIPLEPNQPMTLKSGFRIIIDFHVFRFAFPEAVRAQRIQASASGQDLDADRSESPFLNQREDSEESSEPQVLDWNFAKREAALARLNGLSPAFNQLRDEDLDELFNDIVKVRTSRGRPDSGGLGMGLPHSISENDFHLQSHHESAPMSLKPSGDTAATIWSEDQQSTSSATLANSLPRQDGKDYMRPSSASVLQSLKRSADFLALSDAPKTTDLQLVEDQCLIEQQVKRMQQEMQILRQHSARANANGHALLDWTPLTGFEMRLALKVVATWKNFRFLSMAESTLRYAADVREANVLARQASRAVSYNFTILNGSPPISILDESIDTFIYDSDITSAMTLSSRPQVGIRVIDHNSICIYLWDMTRFQQQLRKMRSLRAMLDRPTFSEHFAVDTVYLEVPSPSYTLLGSVLIPLSTLLVRQSAYYTLTIFCRDTGDACGTCRAGFEVSQGESSNSRPSTPISAVLHDGDQLDFTFCVDMVQAFSSKDVSNVHMQIKLSSLVGNVPAEDIFTSNVVDLDKASTSLLKLRRKITINITTKTLVHIRDQYAVLNLFGRVKESYLHRLERWDELREGQQGISPTASPPSPRLLRPNMRSAESDYLGESSHTVVSHIRILELDQHGVWAPVEVRLSANEPSVFQLHQGLQRRLFIHLSHDSARSLDWAAISCVDLSDVRLISLNSKSTSYDRQHIVHAHRIGMSTFEYTSHGQGILSGTFSWDTSSHGSPHLDGRTRAGQHVLLRLTFQVALVNTDEPAVFSQDIAVTVLRRDARGSSQLFGYLSGTKITTQSSSIFTLRLSRQIKWAAASWQQLDTGGKRIDGQELLGEWQPRTPHLVQDFLALRDMERKQADVQVIKRLLKRSESRSRIEVANKAALLRQCIHYWKKAVGQRFKPRLDRETTNEANLRKKVHTLLPDFKARLLTLVTLQPPAFMVAKTGWVYVLEESPDLSWKRRWLVLTRPYLRFYESSDEQLELRVACLEGCQVVSSSDVEMLMRATNAFTIFTTTNTIILHAATAKEAHDWITTLRCQ